MYRIGSAGRWAALAGVAATALAFALEGSIGVPTLAAGGLTLTALVVGFVIPFVYGRADDGLPRFSAEVRVVVPLVAAVAVGLGMIAFGDDTQDTLAASSPPANEHDGHTEVADGRERGHDDGTHDDGTQAGTHDDGADGTHGRRGGWSHGRRGHDGARSTAGHGDAGHGLGPAAGPGHGPGTGGGPGPGGHDHPSPPPAPVLGKWNTVPLPGASTRCADGGPFGGDHSHGSTHAVPLDAVTQARVDAELDAAQAYALQFPTPAHAEAAGYRKLTPYDIPCIGDHYIRWDITTGDWGIVDGHFDPAQPEMLLYWNGGIVGVSYLVVGSGPPGGFTSANDGWHVHPGMCLANGIITTPPPTPQASCLGPGQIWLEATNLWMAHAWVVPGWESDLGAFSDGNNRL